MRQSNTWLNDCAKINCPIYSKLYSSILIEKKAPLKRSFQYFCVKAHFKQEVEKLTVNEAVEKELKMILAKQQSGMSYHTIDDIDDNTAQDIQTNCVLQTATMIEKYQLNKYFFKKSFDDSQESNQMLPEIWDSNYLFFFKRLATVMKNPNHLFNKIALLNELPDLFPIDVKKTKLDKKIMDTIFKQFSFKFLNKMSGQNKIIKEIYNLYFGAFLISTTVENKNVSFNITDNVNLYEYYNFAKKHLLLEANTSITFSNSHSKVLTEDMDEPDDECPIAV